MRIQKIIFLLFPLLVFNLLSAQSDTVQEIDRIVGIRPTPPSFPGGEEKLFSFIKLVKHHPDSLKAKKIEGKVYVQFVVKKTGELSDIKVLRSPDTLFSQEAIRIVKLMPNWNPGISLTRDSVDVRMVLPIEFKIDKDSVYLNPQIKPTFSGGQLKFRNFMIDSIKIPESYYVKSGIMRFHFYLVVEKDGTISNLKMLGDYNELYYKYYASILNKMPVWIPGEINDESVRSYTDFSASVHWK